MTSAEATERSVVVGTAGHIDHGKTALVRALTGIDTDRLPEEKRRGITVDLGFARCEVATSSGEPITLDIIDVPGHKQLVHNMLAGAGGIDLVMLVISAAEGVMPQTREHLAICELLGLRRGLVVLSKADLVGAEELQRVCEQVRAELRTSFLAEAAILPVSAQSGFGLPPLRGALARLARQIPPRTSTGLPRLPIDRAFVMKGFGTVVTGTLQSGKLTIGQSLTLQPGDRRVRIRGMQRHGSSFADVAAGSRVALNLSGIDVDQVRRGDTLTVPSTLQAIDTLDAEIELLPGAAELNHGARVRLHSFTSETIAAVSIYGYGSVAPGKRQIVRLKLTAPVVLVPGDRFVLRRLSPAQTMAGGCVLDAYPRARTPKRKALAWLEEVRNASEKLQLQLRIERCGVAGIDTAQLAREMGWTEEAVGAELQESVKTGAAHWLGHRRVVTNTAVQVASGRITRLVGSAASDSNGRGFRLSDLLSHSHLAPDLFAVLIKDLVKQNRIVVRGELGSEVAYLPGAKTAAPDPSAARISALAEVYRRAGLNAPLFSDVVRQLGLSEKDARGYVTQLLRDRTLVRLGSDDLFVHCLAINELENRIRALKGRTLDVAGMKEITGLSRKYVIPMLEYLDGRRLTRRQGDTRIVL